MNKKLLVSVFLFFFAFSFMLPLQEEPKEEMKKENEHIILTVYKVERIYSFPERLKLNMAGYTPAYERMRPKEGHNFIFITFTEDRKKDAKIKLKSPPLKKPNISHLIDDQGKIYWLRREIFIDSGPHKQMSYYVFSMPKDAVPTQLKYIYHYLEEPPKSQDMKIGQIDIDLTHIQ